MTNKSLFLCKEDNKESCPLLNTSADNNNSDDDCNEQNNNNNAANNKAAVTSNGTPTPTPVPTKHRRSTRDYNKKKHDNWPHVSLKYGNWTCRQLLLRRKTFLALLLFTLFGFYVNYMLHDDEAMGMATYVPVLHHSHVLGMKDDILNVTSVSVVLSNTSSPSSSSDAGSAAANNTLIQYLSNAATNTTIPKTTLSPPPKGYLVWSDQCKIQNIDPYLHEVMQFFQRLKYKTCAKQPPLTTVKYNETSRRYVLSVDQTVLKDYVGKHAYTCCYSVIERVDEQKVQLSACTNFIERTQLADTIDNVLVKCYAKKEQIYINGHAMVPEREDVRKRLTQWQLPEPQSANNNVPQPTTTKHRPPNVLIIGIDSVSRVNLIRAMPKTAQYLYDNEWFEMSGYNKVDDNTFPNLMAVLAGLNKTTALRKCPPRVHGGLDNCTFIWNLFRDHGYVTAFAEDAVSINTFNYMKKGFQQPPVDYYQRPFLLAAEEYLKLNYHGSLVSCIGYKHAAEHVYDYALEFAQRYRNEPHFGFFWTNTFSHNDISDCTSMDVRINEYLQQFAKLGTYNNTIVIFLSDHGIRFGPTRKTWSGHMEERLPFMFIWLPSYLKQTHPEFVNALSVNKNRLTNPFDLHMTLKHALTLSGRVQNTSALLTPLKDCPNCHSLLTPVSQNRSCQSIGIEDHWCTCIPYQSIYKNSKIVQKLAQRVVVYINDYVAHFQNGTFAKRCRALTVHSIASAYRAHHSTGKELVDTYRIMFYTKPNKGLFEATVRYNERDDTQIITGEISRLNKYVGEADCMDDFGAKKYCVCHNWH